MKKLWSFMLSFILVFSVAVMPANAKSVEVTIGLSPPNSTVFLIIVDAIPVSSIILPNHAPNMKFTRTPSHPSGPPWLTY